MKRLALRTVVTSAAMIGLAAVATPASATHPHVITTPGTCVDKAGAGFGTGEHHGEREEDALAPTFHWQLHFGTPGVFAFPRTDQVSITGKTLCP
jgi:hypothetical protein